MSTTTVLFEDVEPFKDLHFPITFRAQIDYGGLQEWAVDAYEAQGAQGGWIKIDRPHPLWSVIDRYVTSDAGYEAIEDQIAEEIRQENGWVDRRGAHTPGAFRMADMPRMRLADALAKRHSLRSEERAPDRTLAFRADDRRGHAMPDSR